MGFNEVKQLRKSFFRKIQVIVFSSTELQNHRTAGSGGHLWRLPNPSPCSEQGHLQWVAQDSFQVGFGYVQGWRVHSLPGKLVPVPDHSPSRKGFNYVKWNLLCFSLCPLSFSSFTGLHEMRLALPSFPLAPSTKCLYTVVLWFLMI